MKKLFKPRDDLIERVAGEMAATWFEAGMNTPGMDMLRKKYRNSPLRFARQNLEKFIPTAIKTLLTMLQPTSNCTPEMREEIYDAIMDRVNDPENTTLLDDIDIKKVIELSTPKIDQLLRPNKEEQNILKNQKPFDPLENPFKAVRH